jgi:hypothetical protein
MKGALLNSSQLHHHYTQAAPYVAGIIACLLSHPSYRHYSPGRMKDKGFGDGLARCDKIGGR